MEIKNSSWITNIRSNGSLSKEVDLTTKQGKTYTYEVAGAVSYTHLTLPTTPYV